MRPLKQKLNENFLYELYYCAFKYESVCSTIVQYMEEEYLPDVTFQQLHKLIVKYHKEYKSAPSLSVIQQAPATDYSVISLAEDIRALNDVRSVDAVIDMFGEFIKNVKLQHSYKKIGELYNNNEQDKAQKIMVDYAEWLSNFSLNDSRFVDVGATFSDRHANNKKKAEEQSNNGLSPVTRFYIDELDNRNLGRNLRKQLTCLLAATGVGKSHAARHIGVGSCRDGLHVLHFQLEGSEEEVLDAYSGALIERSAYNFERGRFSDLEMSKLMQKIDSFFGTIVVRSFPRFNNQVSTVDIKNGIIGYIKKYNRKPDVVIIDSMDLLTDSSKRNWDAAHERNKRIAVANDLKDLAGDENVWIVATYQATIENRDFLNDEKNVLTEYNCAEAKGLSRPCTHLISLNQSDSERRENTMRLHVAKSRFFAKGEPFKIATDYDNEVFYDKPRTLNIQACA